MRVFKKGLGIVLALAIAIASLYPVLQQVTAAEYQYIEDPSKLKGLDYTTSEELAKVLEEVFAGDIDIELDCSNGACMSPTLFEGLDAENIDEE